MKAPHIYFMSAILLSLTSFGAQAPLPAVDPQVVSVASGGFWDIDGIRGIYRIVVSDFGFDHVSSQVVVQRISEPVGYAVEPVVFSQEVLVEPFAYNFDPPKLEPSSKGLKVTLSGVLAHDVKAKISCIFQLLQDGSVKEVQPCR